jgi:acetyl esterase/lipase
MTELWPAEVEAMREEARAVLGATFDMIREFLGGPTPPPDAPPAERVRAIREQFAKTYAPVPEAEERTIAGVPCRVFVPDGPATAVYLHFHGGGMMLGAPQMNDIPNLELARRHAVAVVSVDYRLAPEHPHPAGPDDGVAVALWLLEQGEAEFGTSRILIGGESAGGYMAAIVLLRMRDELGAAHRVDGAQLVFGVYDWGRSPSQRGIRPTDMPDILDAPGIDFFGSLYLPGLSPDERRDPGISPAFADLRDLPPAQMSVGTADHLLDDTLMLASRWAAAENELDLLVLPDMPHGFMAFPCAMTTWWAERTHAWFTDVLARPARVLALN